MEVAFVLWYGSSFVWGMFGFQALLVSGASDGLLIIWSADHGQDSRELVPKLSLKLFLDVLDFSH